MLVGSSWPNLKSIGADGIDSFDLGRVGVAKVFDFMKLVNTFPIVCSIYIVTAHMYAHQEHCVE